MYKGEVAKVDSVSELVRRVDGVVDGLRSLVDGGYKINTYEGTKKYGTYSGSTPRPVIDAFLVPHLSL